ncbi:TetR/AcrR family transcriptional regulator [Streptomyces sp. NPDC058001]|uniref:TetR/AcrR family transcriptional regulator n=1 Tax=Streptomyces sp. NPDC058001 TaxID=3346300 RepID=UPI0036ECDEA5
MTGFDPPLIASYDAPDGKTELALTPDGEPPALRADAARNRVRLLEAASRLVAECGAANLTMEAVATAAEVGKGTVFRRFGDRTGLLLALLDHNEQRFQAAFLSGPPPMGPGAPALDRLHAYGPAALRHEWTHRDLYLAAWTEPGRNNTVPATRLRLRHLALLLREAGADGDIELLAQTLMNYLDVALVHHLVTVRGMTLERLETGWSDLVTRLATPAPTSTPTPTPSTRPGEDG